MYVLVVGWGKGGEGRGREGGGGGVNSSLQEAVLEGRVNEHVCDC